MTNITLVRNKLKDPTTELLKTILNPVFSEPISKELTQADIIALLNSQSDPNMIYKLSCLYIKQYENPLNK